MEGEIFHQPQKHFVWIPKQCLEKTYLFPWVQFLILEETEDFCLVTPTLVENCETILESRVKIFVYIFKWP